jgi:hypothetical protein
MYYEDAYLEGYYDALLEMNEDYNVLNEVHLSRYAKNYRKISRAEEQYQRDNLDKEIDDEYAKGKIDEKEYKKLKNKCKQVTRSNWIKRRNLNDPKKRKEEWKDIKGYRRELTKQCYKEVGKDVGKKAGKAVGVAAVGVAAASSLNAYNHNLYRAWINKDPKKRKDVTFKEWKKMGKPKN